MNHRYRIADIIAESLWVAFALLLLTSQEDGLLDREVKKPVGQTSLLVSLNHCLYRGVVKACGSRDIYHSHSQLRVIEYHFNPLGLGHV